MYKFLDLLFNFSVKKEEMMIKSFIWGICIIGACALISVAISSL
jgi:hypothetical protein